MTDEILKAYKEVESAVDKSLRGRLDLDIYSINDLCVRLDLHYLTLQKAVKSQALRAIKFGNPAGFRFLHEDVIDWLDSLATKERKNSYIRGLKVRV